jgi:hypothetical protein
MDAGLLTFVRRNFAYFRIFPCIFPCYRDFSFGDRFVSDCALPELRKPPSIGNRPFLRGFLTPIFKFPVSADIDGLLGGFLASGLCMQKFRSRRLDFDY